MFQIKRVENDQRYNYVDEIFADEKSALAFITKYAPINWDFEIIKVEETQNLAPVINLAAYRVAKKGLKNGA